MTTNTRQKTVIRKQKQKTGKSRGLFVCFSKSTKRIFLFFWCCSFCRNFQHNVISSCKGHHGNRGKTMERRKSLARGVLICLTLSWEQFLKLCLVVDRAVSRGRGLSVGCSFDKGCAVPHDWLFYLSCVQIESALHAETTGLRSSRTEGIGR